jgi:hypothetical protein
MDSLLLFFLVIIPFLYTGTTLSVLLKVKGSGIILFKSGLYNSRVL